MPTYVFQCQACGDMKDVIRKMDDRNIPPDFCEKCGKTDMRRMFTAPAISFVDGGHNGEYTKTGPRKGR